MQPGAAAKRRRPIVAAPAVIIAMSRPVVAIRSVGRDRLARNIRRLFGCILNRRQQGPVEKLRLIDQKVSRPATQV